MDRKVFSWSKISKYSLCGIAYEYHYVREDRRPAGPAAAVGRAVHEAIAQNFRLQITTGEMLSEDEVVQLARQAHDQAWLRGEVRAAPGESAEALREEGASDAAALARLYRRDLAPRLEPWRVEHEWFLDLDGTDVSLRGFLDLQEKNGTIHDTKCVARSPAPDTADQSDQLSLYALWSLVADGRMPALSLDSLVKTKTPKLVIQPTTRTTEQLLCAVERVMAAVEGIEKGVFLPAPRDSWQCSEKYCAYFAECKYVRGWAK